ncbi:putative L-ascorbate peroxidase 6 isoform X1 [Benincasa hispida]|uniref:putative L-ascorbate peroxidase 6 isoform X1 n=1 Tax=Benincasa hispida TaxID=102211 RepID=UPI0018FF3FF4|nr:putative L-ascorbate peroxidase 6 isoform X1 [Benincasa hispida]XP_038885451.1 putative L-ascorbate peroxidase 6 isoform X1 [Benincasa hispida]
MTSTFFNPAPPCNAAVVSSSFLRFGFIPKFPAIIPLSSLSTVPFRAKTTVNCSLPAHGDASVQTDFCFLKKREFVFSAALPFLLILAESVEGFKAEAAERLDKREVERIREEVRKVVTKGRAPGLLRLVFHDAGTFEMNDTSGGMNGSIIHELDRPENRGLKKSVKILEEAKSTLDLIRPVSWADVIAVAGAEAVSVCGGPSISVELGRLDSEKPDPEGKLPEESLDAVGLKQIFSRKGFATRELVALSGAHTIGGKGFGSPVVFDNAYFKILLEKPWSSNGGMSSMIGLPSDHALADDDECLRWIKEYANDQNVFFEDFQNAYIKLVNSGAKWKS